MEQRGRGKFIITFERTPGTDMEKDGAAQEKKQRQRGSGGARGEQESTQVGGLASNRELVLEEVPTEKVCFELNNLITNSMHNKDANNNVSAPVMVLSQDMDSYSRLVFFSDERLQQIRNDATQLRNQRGRKKIKEDGDDAFDEISAQISALLEKPPDSWGDRIDHLEGTIRPDIVATYREEKIWGHSASSPYPSVIKAYSHCVNQKSIWPTVYML